MQVLHDVSENTVKRINTCHDNPTYGGTNKTPVCRRPLLGVQLVLPPEPIVRIWSRRAFV